MAIDINKILDESRALGCSDLHFTVGIPPIVRQGGNLRKLSSYPDMTEIDIRGICDNMCNEKAAPVDKRSYRHRLYIRFHPRLPSPCKRISPERKYGYRYTSAEKRYTYPYRPRSAARTC